MMIKRIWPYIIFLLLVIVSIVLLLNKRNEAFLYSLILAAFTGIISFLINRNSKINNGSEINIKGNNNNAENITQINGENNKLNIEGDGNSAKKIKQ